MIKIFSLKIITFKIFFTILILLLIIKNVNAFQVTNDEGFSNVAFAEFIEMIINTTDSKKTHTNKICVFGNDGISREFSVETIDISNNIKNIDNCKVVYIARNKESYFTPEIGLFLAKSQTMTIATFDNFTNLNGILLVQIGRRNFEIMVNRAALKTANLRLGSLATNFIIN